MRERRTGKVRWLAQGRILVVVQAGLEFRSDAFDWFVCCLAWPRYICLLYLLMPPHPLGNVPASKRPLMAPPTLPSSLGKMSVLYI